jgi:AraC-like DNA-binding protein
MSLEKEGSLRFHISLNGCFFVGSSDTDDEAINVKQMEIVMLPHGGKHWIADQTGRELIPSSQAGKACELNKPLFQQGVITNKLICGQVHYDKELVHPILDSLPLILHFANIKHEDPIWMTVNLIDTEMDRSKLNKTSIVDRLTEVLFLQLLNRYLGENKEIRGFFAALRNRRIHKVLGLIHKNPEKPWTIEVLGKKVGMSRATLARQFKSAIGTPPMSYLSNWRMIRAHHLLNYSSNSIEQIAEIVGFSTARTLNKAFLRHYGYTPSELRRK